MADDVVKRLLIKLGISTTEFQAAVKEIKRQLDELYQAEKAKAATRRATAQQDAAQQKQQIDSAQKITKATQDQVVQLREKLKLGETDVRRMKEELTQEKAKLDVKQAQLRVMASQGTVSGEALKILEKEIVQERILLGLKQAQLRSASVGIEAEREGLFGKVLAGASKGLFGGGLLGGVATGALAGSFLGTGLERIVEVLGEKIREVGKETLDATGAAGQLREQFEKLASREGANPEEFLNKLRIATRGLVEDNTLLIKTANNFMQGPLKLEPEQIEKLTGMTIALARAQGTDATEAMNALSRAAMTGYTRQLSWALGISRSEISVRNLGRGVSETARQQLQLDEIMDAMARKLAEVGQPMTTLKDLFSQVKMAQSAFSEDMAYGLTHSAAFADMIQKISTWLQKSTPVILDYALAIGQKLGEAFYGVSTAISSLMSMSASLRNVFTPFLEALGEIREALTFGTIQASSISWREFLADMALGFITVAYHAETASIKIRTALEVIRLGAKGDFEAARLAMEEGTGELIGAQQQLNKDIIANTKFALGTDKIDLGEAGKKQPKAETDQNVNERAKVALELAKIQAKIKYDAAIEELHLEEEAERQKYERGLGTLAEYLDKERALKAKEHAARLTEIDQEEKEKLAALAKEQPGTKDPITGKVVGGMDPKVRADREAIIHAEAQDARIKDAEAADKEEIARTEQLLKDQTSARKTYEQEIVKLTKESLDEQQKLLEEHFKDGLVSADDYIAQRRVLIVKERDAVLEELNQELQDTGQTEAGKARIAVEQIQVRVDAEKKLTELTQQQDQIRLQGMEAEYKRLHDFAAAQIQIAEKGVSFGKPAEEVATLELNRELLSLDELQAKKLTDMLGTVEAGSKQWFEIVKQLGAVNKEMSDINDKIAAATDLAKPLAGLFGEMGKIFGKSDVGNWFSNMSGVMKQLSDFSKTMHATGGAGGLLGSFKAIFTKTPTAKPLSEMDQFNQTVKTGGEKFGQTMDSTINTVKDLAEKAKKGMDELAAKWSSQVEAASARMVQAVNTFTDAAVAAAGRLGGAGGASGNIAAGRTAAGGALSGILSAGTETAGPEAPTGQPGVVGVPPGVSADDISAGLSDLPLSATRTADSLKQLGDAAQGPSNWFKDLSAKMGGFVDKLSGWAAGIGGVVQAVLGAKSTMGGVLGGGMAGMQFGAQFGPIGAAIGAAVGATFGGIFGSKAAEMQRHMESIKAHLQAIEDSIKNGTMTMGEGIKNLQGLRSAAMGELGGSKKGRKQLPAVLQGINDQINQLLDQQKKLLDDLHAQLAILLEPNQYEQILNSLDQIIAKYQEFASAASGNAAEMQMANQYLVASLQAYATTMANDVRAANEQAINDALKLLDLQQQMNQLTLQEYDILTQGVLVRQRPEAMKKGAQIEQLMVQKTQLQMEMDLQKTKVDAEQKMFNLASDRLGLEKQMAALQEKDYQLELAKVAAMQQTLAQLQKALGPGGTLPAGLLTPTGGVNIQALEQLLGLPITALGPAGPGQPYIQNIPPIYQEMIDAIDKIPGYSQFGTQLMAAAATPFDSPQRQALMQELRTPIIGATLVKEGIVQKPVHGVSYDPNWLSFFGWIDKVMTVVNPTQAQGTVPTPTLPTVPGLQTGGTVERTGTALIHEGEIIVPAVARPIAPVIQALQEAGTLTGVPRPTAPVLKAPVDLIKEQLLNKQQMDTHKQIFDLSNIRIANEMELLVQQRHQTQLEMTRMAMMSDLLNKISQQGGNVTSLEGAFAKIYELRGRYGSASFRRETL